MKVLSKGTSLLILGSFCLHAEEWKVENQDEWIVNKKSGTNIEIKEGLVTSSTSGANYTSIIKSYPGKRSAASITLSQVPTWLDWRPIKNIGPKNCSDAPIFMKKAAGDYWLMGKLGKKHNLVESGKSVKLEGFDVPLVRTTQKNVFVAPGGLSGPGGKGYHAWQSRDMVSWVYHGAVTHDKANWSTTAEFVDGKAYIYYDFPNDQDPHLVIDEDLTDGLPGKDMGMVFKDPSHGSDSAVIRDLDGGFHIIYEDWSPINASKRAWDSPLAGHTVSVDGINDFKIVNPAVDERTKPTGEIGTYFHPQWHADDPENYPKVTVSEDIPQHKTKKGDARAQAEYEIHHPEQAAYGDWAAISVGGQYYLFCDYDPVGAKGSKNMSVAWFTSSSIDKQFKFCGNIGSGHPDPDIMFAEGKFYLITQGKTDYISSGPWVEGVEIRVGVDTDNDKAVDQWTEWTVVKESYSHMEGFSKQVSKKPAALDLSGLPDGYGFKFEVRLSNENKVKPVLDSIRLTFSK